MKKLIITAIALCLSVVSCSEDNVPISTENSSIENSKLNKNSNGATSSIIGEDVAKSATSLMSSRGVLNPIEDFKLYKATIIFPRVASNDPNENRSAKSFALISYSDMISSTYIVDGVVYNDNGSVNDLIAGDEIYTSEELYKADMTVFDFEHLKYIASPDFTAHNEIKQDFANGNLERRAPPRGIKGFLLGLASDFVMSCHYSYTTQGTTVLGFSCASGCWQIDCR